jgi:disulfide bond formation protein DsbB
MDMTKQYIAFFISLAAIAGSLFFSEVMKFPPCTLCWYQRIFIYPLAFLIPVGILLKDVNLRVYSLSLLVPGALIALYHNLLYYKIIPEEISPCREGVSCTTKQLELFGFITIPLLSLITFLFLIGLFWKAKIVETQLRESR